MTAVPRQPSPDTDAEAPVPGVDAETAPALPAPPPRDIELTTHNETSLAPVPVPLVRPDPGLYAVLGLDPTVSDAEIQTTYRRMAARLLNSGGNIAALRQLNAAYEVLGNPVRRSEYDRIARTRLATPPAPTPLAKGAKVPAPATRRRRPRHAVQPRYSGFGDVLVLLVVVALAAGVAVLIIPRLSINLSGLNALSNVVPGLTLRRVESTGTPAPTRVAPTPTVRPGLADRFAGSTVAVSNPSPARNTSQNIVVRLRRDGQPAAGLDVWATLQYRTTEERWPANGTVKTDASGQATIPFDVGGATPGFQVQVHVFALADDQQVSWSTSFTPR